MFEQAAQDLEARIAQLATPMLVHQHPCQRRQPHIEKPHAFEQPIDALLVPRIGKITGGERPLHPLGGPQQARHGFKHALVHLLTVAIGVALRLPGEMIVDDFVKGAGEDLAALLELSALRILPRLVLAPVRPPAAGRGRAGEAEKAPEQNAGHAVAEADAHDA